MRRTTDIASRETTRWRGRAVLAALVAVAYGGVAHAAAPPPGLPVDPCETPVDTNYLVADATGSGVIDLIFFNPKGARVLFYECVGDKLVRLGARRAAPGNPAVFEDATTWRCDRPTRRFSATAVLPDGTLALGSYSVRTASCANRFELDAPRSVKPGARARVRVVDRWGIGDIRPELCIGPSRERPSCRTLDFPRAVTVASHRFRATARGRWRVELRVERARVRTAVAVGESGARYKPPPIVLATGDSTMQGIDSFLGDELGRSMLVRSDVRPGSGISRGVYWHFRAQSQARKWRQRVTVMSVGAASDGLPIPTALGVLQQCCGEPWMKEYTNRTRAIMRTYLRRGSARVVWLTPPEPRHGPRAAITHAVNVAVERAAQGLAGVTVIRVDLMFGGSTYRDVVRYRGRDVRVREPDGVHLNVAGTAIVAKAVADAIRAGETGSR
jgi:hypothetical protein